MFTAPPPPHPPQDLGDSARGGGSGAGDERAGELSEKAGRREGGKWEEGEKIFELYLVSESAGNGVGGVGGGEGEGGPCDTAGFKLHKSSPKKKKRT